MKIVIILFLPTENKVIISHITLDYNCAFPQNFHTRKLGEITVFYAVMLSVFATGKCRTTNLSLQRELFFFDIAIDSLISFPTINLQSFM